MYKILIVLAFGLIHAQSSALQTSSANQDSSQQGKSVDLTESFIKKTRTPYVYTPVIIEFWSQIQEKLNNKDYEEILKISEKQLRSYGDTTPEGQEARLAQAISFYHQGFIYAAFKSLLDIAQNQMGTEVGSNALYYLAEIVKDHEYDKKALFTFIDNQESVNLHYKIQSFVSYFKSILLLKFGYKNWANKHLALIDEDTYWDIYRKYMSSLALIGKSKITTALAKLEGLLEKENLNEKLKSRIHLQMARLFFENGEFKKAEDSYKMVRGLGLREKGRVLLERAWTYYYQQKYSQSLGVLHALKAPYFKTSIKAEPYILEMLIFKDLCHYEAAANTAKEFMSRFEASINRIQARKDLKKDPIIFGMAVMDLNIQMTANLISKIKDELSSLKKKDWKKYSFYIPLLKAYILKNRELQIQSDHYLNDKIRVVALELLDSRNQIHFLEYTASIDAVKIQSQNKANDFKHVPITRYKFDKIFWPVQQEYWFDELEDYTVNISSQCLEETDKKQLQLEESFK